MPDLAILLCIRAGTGGRRRAGWRRGEPGRGRAVGAAMQGRRPRASGRGPSYRTGAARRSVRSALARAAAAGDRGPGRDRAEVPKGRRLTRVRARTHAPRTRARVPARVPTRHVHARVRVRTRLPTAKSASDLRFRHRVEELPHRFPTGPGANVQVRGRFPTFPHSPEKTWIHMRGGRSIPHPYYY